MFQIQYGNDADNILMVCLLLSMFTPSQGLFSDSCSTSEEAHKKVEKSRAKTGDLNWSNGCSTK